MDGYLFTSKGLPLLPENLAGPLAASKFFQDILVRTLQINFRKKVGFSIKIEHVIVFVVLIVVANESCCGAVFFLSFDDAT